MWNVIPKNMLDGYHTFFLSLFSVSCGLISTIMDDIITQQSRLPTSIRETDTNVLGESNIPEARSELVTPCQKQCLPCTSDSDDSLNEGKSTNILISCVGRRSKRRKKKKNLEKNENSKIQKLNGNVDKENSAEFSLGTNKKNGDN